MASTSTYGRKIIHIFIVLVVIEVLLLQGWHHRQSSNLGTSSGLHSKRFSANNPPPLSINTSPIQSQDGNTIDDDANEESNASVLLPLDPLLRVFVYEHDVLPPSLTVDALERCVVSNNNTHHIRRKNMKKNNFMADVPIIRLFESYPGRTYHPSEADVFVVPYAHMTHCICNLPLDQQVQHARGSQVSSDEIDSVLRSLMYFNETTKDRHLFISSGDYNWCHPMVENMPLLLTLGPKPEGQQQRDGDSDSRSKRGVIVIPYLNDLPEYQPSVLRHQNWNFTKRKYAFAYFLGRPSKLRILREREDFWQGVMNSSDGSQLAGRPFVMQRVNGWTKQRQDFLFQTYRNSIFCPCLPGDNAPQKRFFDVILSGCLPVVLSFNESSHPARKSWFHRGNTSVESSYPFAKGMFDEFVEIDYESFVVQVQENVSNIKPTLEALLANPEELQRRQATLARYAPLLSYGLGRDAHKYDDAFLRILRAIRFYLNGLTATTNRPVVDSHRPTGAALTSNETTSLSIGSNEPQLATDMGIARGSLPHGPKTHPRPHLTNRLLQKFIVVPERKLLFCYIEKVGCSMFNHLFRMLRLGLPEVSRNASEASFQANFTWFRNTPRHHGLGKAQLENLLVDPNWTKAVFYRDPVTRFLSAYRSKCEVGHDINLCNALFGKRNASFDEAIDAMKNRRMPLDRHIAPASQFCGGLHSTIEYYDFVHELHPSTSPTHVESLLLKVGVDAKMTKSLVDTIVRTGGMIGEHDMIGENDERFAIQLGVQLGVRLGYGRSQTSRHNTNAEKGLCEYYDTTEKLDSITTFYKRDYDTFQLSPRGLNCSFDS